MNNKKISIEEQLKMGLPAATFTSGVSMEPLLYDHKTHVIIMPLQRELTVGELPIYLRPDGIYVIHRVIGVDETCYYTRGDNCLTHEQIPKEWAIGVIVEIFRNGKHIQVTDRRYRCYVYIWNKIYPLRRIWYRLRLRYGHHFPKLENKYKDSANHE